MAFDLFPGRPTAIPGKLIQLGPQVDKDLVDGEVTGIQQTQRLGLQGIGQADGKRERLRLGHVTTPVWQAPASRTRPGRLFFGNASRRADRQRRLCSLTNLPSIPVYAVRPRLE